MGKSADMLDQLHEALVGVLTQRREAIEKLDEWAKRLDGQQGKNIPWEAVEDLYRSTLDVLTKSAADL